MYYSLKSSRVIAARQQPGFEPLQCNRQMLELSELALRANSPPPQFLKESLHLTISLENTTSLYVQNIP